MTETLEDLCDVCGSRLIERPAASQPVLSTAVFAISFAVFFSSADKLKLLNAVHVVGIGLGNVTLVAWSITQVALGLWVIRGRVLARRKISHCIRCGPRLPS